MFIIRYSGKYTPTVPQFMCPIRYFWFVSVVLVNLSGYIPILKIKDMSEIDFCTIRRCQQFINGGQPNNKYSCLLLVFTKSLEDGRVDSVMSRVFARAREPVIDCVDPSTIGDPMQYFNA